jgi:glycerol kinase
MGAVRNGYIGAIDQGTTSTRFVIFDRRAQPVASHQLEHKQIYPKPGWVEHDPVEIWHRTRDVISGAMKKSGLDARDLSAIGLTNQRETVVAWNPKTGQPYGNAVVWQDTRTDQVCRRMAGEAGPDRYRDKTGLPLSTYFSGPKIRWMLDHRPELAAAVDQGDAVFGTVDAWLMWNLSGGPGRGILVTDVTNAGRTMLMNLETLAWDSDLLADFGIPETALPQVRSSSEVYAHTAEDGVLGRRVPLAGILGDQQAALFGQVCFEEGQTKNTYGTGCFMLKNIGPKPVRSNFGLLTTVGYRIGDRPPAYALEGSVAVAGSLVQWLRDNLGLIPSSADIEALAASVPDSGGIYFVPAFSGLFAPHWRSDARGVVIGLSHFVNRGHLARAVLEATAYQTKEIFDAMERDTGLESPALRVDGGMVVNELLMRFQADLLGVPVVRPKMTETTVLGAAMAAGLAVGVWSDQRELIDIWEVERRFEPNMEEAERARRYAGWTRAVERTLNWIED